ncbi:MAG: ArnT family glycosyltransferase [Phenylobacterium sp.]|uniref:ArnT family glycosyltransferase n=1 Tax=Phenylobacterium sp. TaxID=1871053 RepID=UPI003919F4C6
MSGDRRSVHGVDSAWRGVLLVTAALTFARLAALFATPLQLYPDEAQYWLWSRTLDWGYYSKPPMIAWAIWATTALGGDGEAWVRLAAPLFHAGAALAVFAIGRRLYGASAGFAAFALYMLMPGVQLSSAVIATDAPLLLFLALALLAYVELPHADGRRRVWTAAAFGAALGLAFLSKYAAIYGLIGAGLHAAASRQARAVWRPATIAAAIAAFAAVLAPNLIWNAAHGFATVQHTASNADWGAERLFNPAELGDFVASQFGVFGPIPFAVLIGGAAVTAWRRRLSAADAMLLCFALPALVIVAGQAFVSRANANWAGAGFVAGSILAGAWLVRWRARGWLVAAIATQALMAVLFLTWAISPSTAEAMGASNSFKRAKGWSEMTELVVDRARREPNLTAIAVNDRFLFNAMAYYARDEIAAGELPPLTMWVRAAHPQTQAEMTDPLTPQAGARVLGVILEQAHGEEMRADFARVSGREFVSVRLDRKRTRRAELFIGEGYAPRPRDPVSGLPTPP